MTSCCFTVCFTYWYVIQVDNTRAAFAAREATGIIASITASFIITIFIIAAVAFIVVMSRCYN